MIQVHDETNDRAIATTGRAARTFWTRLRGLIGRPALKAGEALLIMPCRSIHTHFMGFPIDVIYVNAENQIVGLDQDLAPWRFGRIHQGSKFVIELPAGTIEACGCGVGDQLRILGVDSK